MTNAAVWALQELFIQKLKLNHYLLFFFCWTQKEVFWRMLVTRQFLVTIDFIVKKIRLRKSLVIINCLVTNILQHEGVNEDLILK